MPDTNTARLRLRPGAPRRPARPRSTFRWLFEVWRTAALPLFLMGVVRSAAIYSSGLAQHQGISLYYAFMRAVPNTAFWILITPLLVQLARRPRGRPAALKRALPGIVLLGFVAHFVCALFEYAAFWGLVAVGVFGAPYVPGIWILLIEWVALDLFRYFGVIAVVLAYDWYRDYRTSKRRALRLRAELAEAELELLRVQLQPHFLFNALQAISELVHVDPDRADRAIVRIGELLRHGLSTAHRAELPLAEELATLETYVSIERLRWSERLEVTIDAAPDTLGIGVPNSILQPVVENSIRHGLRGRDRGRVHVRAGVTDSRLELVVEDDGEGLSSESPVIGHGLANVQARLARLYGRRSGMSMTQREGGGVRVTLWLPARAIVE